MIAEAYQILENERCQQCGLPKYICHNDDNDIHIDVEIDHCFAKEAIGKKEDLLERDRTHTVKGQKVIDPAPPGDSLQPSPWTRSGASLGSFREGYYTVENEKREAKLSTRPKPPPKD